MSSCLPAVIRGDGRVLLFIHGSATDHAAWSIQLGTLASGFRVVAYDRRGAMGTPAAADPRVTTADHARDAAAILAQHATEPALVIGSSYGAVVALELTAHAPERLAGLVLCEPPLGIGPDGVRAPIGFGCALEQLAACHGGPAAAEMFLRAVLGERAYARVHPAVRARTLATWPQIHADARALAAWPMDQAGLRRVAHDTLLLGGDRSPARFGDALDALALVLPRSRRATLAGAGHAMQLDQPRAFDRLIRGFAAEVFAA